MTPQFKKAVETYAPRFMSDLSLDALKVSGILGNFAVESDQFRALQEYKPTVKGSRGGWGWPQWTGPRRRQFEAWAKAQGFKLDDPEAFYQFVLVELRGSEKAALAALRKTKTLDSATTSFMSKYERPGVPHLERRKALALEALHVLEAKIMPMPPARPAAVSAPTAHVPPEVAYVPAPISLPLGATAPWWLRWALPTAPAPVAAEAKSRPGLKPNGDPALYDVQATLNRIGYPTLRDGLNGDGTRASVLKARRRNGMGDGEDALDPAFLAALPGMLPALVSETRADASEAEMRQQSPDLFAPLKGIFGGGLATLGTAVLGGASDGGLLSSVKDTADHATATLQSVQAGIGTIAAIGSWIFAHWWLPVGLLGLYLAVKGYIGWLKVKALWRQGRAS